MANYTPPASILPTQSSFNTSSSPSPMDISPSSLDIIPALASILARLQTTSSTAVPNALLVASSPQPSSQSQTQTFSQGQSHTPLANAAATKDLSNPFSSTPITIKDIPAATDGIKHRLQKTCAQVSQLPDMDRCIEEQEQEIRELEEKIREQRKVLRDLKALGASRRGPIKDEETQTG